jgi:competence protein ComEA
VRASPFPGAPSAAPPISFGIYFQEPGLAVKCSRADAGAYPIRGDSVKRWLAGLSFGWLMSTAAQAAVDINTATRSELEAVKGIGPTKAKAIVAYRKKHGTFKSLGDLAEVEGFGEASVAKLRNELTVGTGTPKAGARK